MGIDYMQKIKKTNNSYNKDKSLVTAVSVMEVQDTFYSEIYDRISILNIDDLNKFLKILKSY
ncbi:hypothetical protein CSB08_01205 [Candidatus Gracilibacteria bacterium]|nr:MAG: hypothetical protein CSB08_01205 [Candidatus Gracilibacteria bacterium]PIE85412.1 MAG: hypothetical protein CSA08_02440 [Candidatus Gracilibacteria bacterium]